MSIEDVKQSTFAPGPVHSDETLLRVVFAPEHIDSQGNLLPAAIPTADLALRGFSVHRKQHVRKKTILDQIKKYISKIEGRSCKGIGPIECAIIRSCKDTKSDQAFIVIDDALTKENYAHAKVMFKNKHSPAKMKGLRNRLKGEFKIILAVDKVVNNLPSEFIIFRVKRYITNNISAIKRWYFSLKHRDQG